MLNIVPFGLAVLEKIFQHFTTYTNVYQLYISICKSLSPLSGAIHDPRDFI